MVDDEEEEEELFESEMLVRKKNDKELDDLLKIRKELEAQEVKAKNAKITLETQKLLFPPWSMERIQNLLD